MEAFKTQQPHLYYEALGHLKLGEGKVAEAVAALDTAFHLSTFHEFPPYEYALALAYFENGQLGEAASHLENVLRKVPVQIDIEAPAILLLGKVYEASGWRKQALEQYQRLLEMWANGDGTNHLLVDARRRYEGLQQSLRQSENP